MKSYPKPFSIAVIISIIINGCSPNTIPYKGKYGDSPTEFNSTISGDSVWTNITRIFSENGLAIKNIDKQKGRIVSEKTKFISVYTFEDNDGKLINAKAWVVLQKVYIKKKAWNLKTLYGEWSIQIKETGTGVTAIKVDPVVICIGYPNRFTLVETTGQSTGELEKLIDSSLQTNLNKVSKN